MAKLPYAHITRIAEEYLQQTFIKDHFADSNNLIDRRNTLKTYRLIIRLLTEMQLRCVVALARIFEQDYLAGNAFVALLAETGRISPNTLVSGLGDVGRPITIRAMARSFTCPYETMRRAIQRLSQLDLVDQSDDGVVLRHSALDRPEVRAYLLEMHDIMVTLAEDLFVFAKLPMPESARAGDTGDTRAFVILASLDMHLLAVEGLQGMFADWTGLLVSSAIIAGNVRHITYHPELAFTYAADDQPPPMSLRKPVQFKTLCDTLPISPTTAWRRITVMKMLGSMKSIDGGLVIDSGWLRNQSLIANACDRLDRMHHIINRMVANGVPLDAMGQLYIKGPVAPIAL